MSFMKRMFSKVGIGNAKVDTVLEGDQFAAGEWMAATVYLTGGKVAQDIDEVYFSIHTQYLAEIEIGDDENHRWETAVIAHVKLGESLHLEPGEKLEIPLELELPLDAPLTIGRTQVWLQTGLDIRGGVDPSDRDFIEVVPDTMVDHLFRAFEDLGFRLVQAECERAPHGWGARLPFIQEFEFKPTGGEFRRCFEEVEMVYQHHGDALEVFVEIDRRARGMSGMFSEWLGKDESRVRFTLTEADLDRATDILHDLLASYT